MQERASCSAVAVLACASAPSQGSAPSTTAVTLTEFAMPAGTAPGDIADSVDGRTLWVTLIQPPTGDVRPADAVNSIGRFDTATGALQVFKLPTPGEPRNVAVGDDGRVYVISRTAPFAHESKLSIFDPASSAWSERLLNFFPRELVAGAGPAAIDSALTIRRWPRFPRLATAENAASACCRAPARPLRRAWTAGAARAVSGCGSSAVAGVSSPGATAWDGAGRAVRSS